MIVSGYSPGVFSETTWNEAQERNRKINVMYIRVLTVSLLPFNLFPSSIKRLRKSHVHSSSMLKRLCAHVNTSVRAQCVLERPLIRVLILT